jgi:transposase
VQDDCIAVALGLPEVMILGQVELDDHFEVTIRYLRQKVACPRCGSVMVRKHESTFQRKKDRKLRDKIVILTLEKRRFRCLSCGKVFTEPDEVFGPRRRSTRRLRSYLGERARRQAVSHVAKEERVSESLVRRCFTEETALQLGVDGQEPKASKVMGLDEFSVKKRMFDTTISDLEERKVLGIVEGCGKTTLEKYFTALPDPEIVEVVAMDMHEPFRQAVQMCLSRANIVVDKFHVIVHVNQALDKVRTRLQSKESKGKRWLLFHRRYLLLRRAESLSPEEQSKLGRLFSFYPELAIAWKLKEGLREWYKSSSRAEAELSLRHWEESVCKAGLKEFGTGLPMFRNWRNEILNYFDYHVTNGFVEGKNNRIKAIKRMAYGYRNIDNFRRRILLTNNEIAASTKASGGFHAY